MSEGGIQFFESCAACAASLESETWHPVATESVEGETNLYSFCDESCKAAWAEAD